MQREHSQPKVGCVNCSKSKGKVKWNDGVCKAWAAQESSKQEENPTAIQGLATQNKSHPWGSEPGKPRRADCRPLALL